MFLAETAFFPPSKYDVSHTFEILPISETPPSLIHPSTHDTGQTPRGLWLISKCYSWLSSSCDETETSYWWQAADSLPINTAKKQRWHSSLGDLCKSNCDGTKKIISYHSIRIATSMLKANGALLLRHSSLRKDPPWHLCHHRNTD